MNPQFVIATYQVLEQNQTEFIVLLKETETLMRKEKLITSKPVFRMRSVINPKIIVEIFEWTDSKSFEKAQNSPTILSMWSKFESIWVKGGFGIKEVPEASQPWAQFPSIQ
mgnify:CR=1 FL=1